jgi:hypothetical protein
MSEINIHHPHDGFFKHSLSNLTVAKDLLQAHLSPAITQRIQWDSLRLSNKSFTNEKLAQLHSDVVYSCQIDNKSAYSYILVAQPTTPDRLLPLRFLKYNVALLTEHLVQTEKGENRQHLPITLNLCSFYGTSGILHILGTEEKRSAEELLQAIGKHCTTKKGGPHDRNAAIAIVFSPCRLHCLK